MIANQIAGLMGVSAAVPTGDYDSITTSIVGAGGVASVTFSSIPATYKHLQIRAIARSATAGTGNQEIQLTYNGNTANYYRLHQIYGDGATVTASVVSNTTNNFPLFMPTNGQTANAFATAIIDILDYADTNKNKVLRSLGGFDLNGSGYAILRSGLWANTSAITSITLAADAGGTIAEYSHFALYGIKG
jgi:hypothetical protein